MRSAVCVLIEGEESGTYIAVSRRNDYTKWGLPGGKVDPGETNLEAVQRETFEEVGFLPHKIWLEPIYSGLCEGGEGGEDFWVTTYASRYVRMNLSDLVLEEGLQVMSLTRSNLTDPLICPFAKYNRFVFAALEAYQS